MSIEKEFAIWGKEKGKYDDFDDTLLYTRAQSMDEAQRVMAILSEKYGCHSMRVQVLDGVLPDFKRTLSN